MRRALTAIFVASALPAAAQDLSIIDCTAYRAALTAGGASVEALAKGAREIDLSGLRAKADEETRRAISRLEDANVNLQPAMAEWAAAATALSDRVRTICAR